MKLFLILIISFNFLFSQSIIDTLNNPIDNDFFDNDNLEEQNLEYINDILYYYRLNPININTAVYSDLAQFPFVSHNTIFQILNYRNAKGKIKTINEIFDIPNINYNEVINLLPYITLKDFSTQKKYNRFFYQNRNKILQDTSISFTNRIEVLNKLSYNYDNYSLNFTQIKNTSDNKFFSDYSYSLSAYNIFGNDNLTIGNYKLKFGCGLIMDNGYFRQSITNPNSDIKYNTSDIRNYYGKSPYTIKEGLAYQYQHNLFSTVIFYSRKKLSAKIDTNNNIISIYSSRYENKEQIIANRIGTILSYNFDFLYTSLLFENLTFEKPFFINNSKYKSFNNLSLYFNLLLPNILLNSEIAYQNKRFIYEISGNFKLSQKLNIGSQYIKFKSDMLFANSKIFGFYKPSFENEIFYNTITYSNKKESYYFYSLYQKTNKTSFNDFIKIDNKYAFGYINQQSLTINHLITASFSQKDFYNQNKNQISTRYSIKIIPSSKANYITDIRITSNGKNTGYAFSEMLNYSPNKNISLKAKFNYFSIENYDNIIYTFENDLSGYITSNVLYKDGFSSYFIIKYQIKNFAISGKYYYKYQEKISELVKEKSNSYFVLQFDYEI